VDLGSVRAAPTPVLIRGTVAAARNAQGLLDDAQVLADAGSVARAYSLAAFAVEEAGKAAGLVLLTVMPAALRKRAPVGRMLEWHQLKQVHGLVIAEAPYRIPEIAPGLAAMPAGELAQFLTALDGLADEADRLKRRGMYVDVVRGARIGEPSEITESEVLSQLARAGQAVSAAGQVLEPETQAWLENPPAETVELSRAWVSALMEAGYGRTPDAAVDVVLNAVIKLRERIGAGLAEGAPSRAKRGTMSSRRTQRARPRETLTGPEVRHAV
jgi:AbiV family abortive infection protein